MKGRAGSQKPSVDFQSAGRQLGSSACCNCTSDPAFSNHTKTALASPQPHKVTPGFDTDALTRCREVWFHCGRILTFVYAVPDETQVTIASKIDILCGHDESLLQLGHIKTRHPSNQSSF